MKTAMFMLFAAMAAFVIPVQAIVNGRLGIEIENRILAALISFAGGTAVLALLLVIAPGGIPSVERFKQLPWFLFTGGLLGAIFVTVVLSLVPQIGTAKVLAAAIVGQLVMAVIIDHFGAMNVPKDPVNWYKIAGCVLLVGGTILIQMGKGRSISNALSTSPENTIDAVNAVNSKEHADEEANQ